MANVGIFCYNQLNFYPKDTMTHTDKTLPAIINLDKWSNIGFTWQGELTLAELERLSADAQADTPLMVLVDLTKKDGILWLTYEVKGCLSVVCQRCLSPLMVDVSGVYQMALLDNDAQIDQVADQEYVLLSELGNPSHLPIKDLLEDELILALPLSPRHDDCELLTNSVGDLPDKSDDNPFAILASLKSKPS